VEKYAYQSKVVGLIEGLFMPPFFMRSLALGLLLQLLPKFWPQYWRIMHDISLKFGWMLIEVGWSNTMERRRLEHLLLMMIRMPQVCAPSLPAPEED